MFGVSRRDWQTNARAIPNGFTFVELLVLIAIICVLLALLLPALQKTLLTARLVVCANNLKQQYMGYTNYTTEFNGFMPSPGDGAFSNRLATYGSAGGPINQWMNSGKFYEMGYLVDAGLFTCPDNPLSVLPGSPKTDTASLQEQFDYYAANGCTSGGFSSRGNAFITYIHRSTAMNAYTRYSWDMKIDYYNYYMGASAWRFQNNLAGSALGRSGTHRLPAAVALMADLPPLSYWADSKAPYNSVPHQRRAFNVLYADGLVVTRPAYWLHPFFDEFLNIGSGGFAGKLFGADIYHPSWRPAGMDVRQLQYRDQ